MNSAATAYSTRDVEAVCSLVYQIWYISVTRAQPSDVHAASVGPLKINSAHPLYGMRVAQFRPGAAFPLPQVQEELQRAILMYNQCNLCWIIMKDTLIELLHILDPAIRVDILHVDPKPKFELRTQYFTGVVRHSLIRITTAHGQFILDLTGEQYGFGDQERFLPMDAYLRQCVSTSSEVLPMDEWFRTRVLFDHWSNVITYNITFWPKVSGRLETLVRKWQDSLAGGRIRPEHLVCETERNKVVGWWREMMYSGYMSL